MGERTLESDPVGGVSGAPIMTGGRLLEEGLGDMDIKSWVWLTVGRLGKTGIVRSDRKRYFLAEIEP